MFTLKEDFLESLLRGMKAELLQQEEYAKLRQCDSVIEMKLYLVANGYHAELHREIGPIDPNSLVQLCTRKLLKSFNCLVSQASEPLASLLSYIRNSYMIDNVILIMAGAMRGRSFTDLFEKCHPLGLFDSMENLLITNDLSEIHRLVLIDTPISKYFNESLGRESIDESNVEFIRNSVYKAYIEDFVSFCNCIENNSEDLLDLLTFEADRRVITIIFSTFGTELSLNDKLKLFPTCGNLYPNGQLAIGSCMSADNVYSVLETYASRSRLFSRFKNAEPSSLDKILYEEECLLCESTFMRRSRYAVFVAYIKLFEQELRNIMWIAECIAQQQKFRIEEGLVICSKMNT